MYNVTQCRTPTWPPLCPFKIVDNLVPCEIWTCTGQPPNPEPPEPPNTNLQVGSIVAVVLSIFCILALLLGLACFFKQVNFIPEIG